MSRNLPSVSENQLQIWDYGKQKCAGYLNKKASQSSAFSKGKWQKRWFYIDTEIGAKENYSLQYGHSPDDKIPRSTIPLHGATVKISTDTQFVVTSADGNTLSLSADTSETMQNWISTLETVISVSNIRERMIHQFDPVDTENGDGAVEDDQDGNRNFKNSRNGTGQDNKGGAFRSIGGGNHRWPTVRIDIDATSIPPGSPERHKFIEIFANDLSYALGIDVSLIEVISIKSAPGMDWLSLVEFDLNLPYDPMDEESESHSHTESQSRSRHSHTNRRRDEMKRKLLKLLLEMIADTSSVLYNGYISSKIDPSFSLNLIENKNGGYRSKTVNNNDLEIEEIFSEDPKIMKILQKYKDIQLPDDFEDETRFQITVYFEDRFGTILVPNPAVLTKRYCALWPFQIKQALGFMGTMQELWIEPSALTLRDTASKPAPIDFSPSVRCGGQSVINAVHLIPNASYDISCIDKRNDALKSLSEEEMEVIKETFQRCDLDGDGGISKPEMEEIVRNRTHDRKLAIEQKFQKHITENDLTDEEIDLAEQNKAQYLQQIHEAQIKLLKMFEAADLNGDGSISFTEFILAEAWWLRCTINPDRAHLF